MNNMEDEKDFKTAFRLANTGNITVEKQRELAMHPSWVVRERLGGNPFLHFEVFDQLASDEDKDVRMAVAWNQNTPIDTFDKLLLDGDKDIRIAVLFNLNNRR